VKAGAIAEGFGGDVGGQRIEQVGGAMSAGVTVLDLGGRSLLRGLIDGYMHVLLQGDSTLNEYAYQLLEEELAHRGARAVRAMDVVIRRGFTWCRGSESRGQGSPTLHWGRCPVFV
jgi:imidazolonepropionase-like amidohydrolase